MLKPCIVINDKVNVELDDTSLFKSRPRYALCNHICDKYFIQLIEENNLLHLKLTLKEYILVISPEPYRDYFEQSIILRTTEPATKKDLKFLTELRQNCV